MSETYLMPLTVPQRLLILVMMRLAHNDDAAFLTEQLLPRSRDLRPRTFAMSAHNVVATDQVFFLKRQPVSPQSPRWYKVRLTGL